MRDFLIFRGTEVAKRCERSCRNRLRTRLDMARRPRRSCILMIRRNRAIIAVFFRSLDRRMRLCSCKRVKRF